MIVKSPDESSVELQHQDACFQQGSGVRPCMLVVMFMLNTADRAIIMVSLKLSVKADPNNVSLYAFMFSSNLLEGNHVLKCD